MTRSVMQTDAALHLVLYWEPQVEAESAELVRRLIEMKDREADRMNEINRLEAETVSGG